MALASYVADYNIDAYFGSDLSPDLRNARAYSVAFCALFVSIVIAFESIVQVSPAYPLVHEQDIIPFFSLHFPPFLQ